MIHKTKKEIFIGFEREFGGHLQAEFTMKYADLVKVIGKPNSKCDGYKEDAQWYIHTPKGGCWIYNYKDGKNYLGDEGLKISELTEWHIGADSKEIAEIVLRGINDINSKITWN